MSDVVIIGGGVIGLLTARQLALQGANVTVIDAKALGQEASWAGGGIISPLYPWRYPDDITQLARHSQQLYPALAEDLFSQTGIDIELERSGLLALDATDIIPALAWGKTHQVPIEAITSQNLPALWMPEVMQVRNSRFMKALIAHLTSLPVTLKTHQRVRRLCAKENTITHIDTEQETITGKTFIITAGAWSGQLLSTLNIDFPITPVKGQMLLFKSDEKILDNIILYRNHYLIPRRDGHILAGSTLEYHAGYDQIPTESGYHELYQAAITILPNLTYCPMIAQWSGLRPLSPTGSPFIGKVAPYANLYMNSGHFRNGLVLAPGAVEMLLKVLKFAF